MNDEEKWNSGNAPQNDRDTGRFNEPPRYEHYNMHQTYVNEIGQESEKKETQEEKRWQETGFDNFSCGSVRTGCRCSISGCEFFCNSVYGHNDS